MTNLIRNGGFERGCLDFWTFDAGISFEASGTLPYRGVWCGKLTASAIARSFVCHNDYIEVQEGQLINIHGYYKNSVLNTVEIQIRSYDADYQLLDTEAITNEGVGVVWTPLTSQYAISQGTAYIRLQIGLFGAGNGDILYMDNVLVEAFSVSEWRHQYRTIADVEDLVGAVNAYTPSQNYYGGRHVYADLTCSSLAGAGATLDVNIMEYNKQFARVGIASFTQMLASGTERILLPMYTGYFVHTHYITNASVTDCDFKVDIVKV